MLRLQRRRYVRITLSLHRPPAEIAGGADLGQLCSHLVSWVFDDNVEKLFYSEQQQHLVFNVLKSGLEAWTVRIDCFLKKLGLDITYCYYLC